MIHVNFQSVLLRLKKHRFLCKHCEQAFIAETKLVERHCFISNMIKRTIAMELRENQSMTLIAKHLSVSNSTVRNSSGTIDAQNHRLIDVVEDRRQNRHDGHVLPLSGGSERLFSQSTDRDRSVPHCTALEPGTQYLPHPGHE